MSNNTKTVTTDILLQVFRVRKFSMEFTLILDATFNLGTFIPAGYYHPGETMGSRSALDGDQFT